jgi:ADP-L-glycero-D-manno-heptose 6-epimerase
MIIVTGSAGFIGSCLVAKLNQEGFRDILIVDDFSNPVKNKNIQDKSFSFKLDRELFFEWLKENHHQADFVFHLGARTDTTEFNMAVFDKLNLNYSKHVWEACTRYGIPLVYASSAATYGDGELGYEDDHELISSLKPLNPYGVSKNEFDKWVLTQKDQPPFWFGLKFFNVYGPNEYHKGRMASVIWHAFDQIRSRQNERKVPQVKLFRSHRSEFKDGEQLRDFIYVKDVVDVLYFLMDQTAGSGIYNLGTGKARTFLDLVTAVFNALKISPEIEFIDIPADIREKYQYFTEAKMQKLQNLGYTKPFHSLENGIEEYVRGYLSEGHYF